MLSNHLICCCPSSSRLQSFPTSGSFPMHIKWPEYWSFSISPSNEYSELISFSIDGFDLLAVQGTLKRVFSNTTVQSIGSLALSFLNGPPFTSIHGYRKKHSLTIWTCVSKVISLLYNMLCRFVIAFHRRSKGSLISWLQSPSVVIFEPKKIKLDQKKKKRDFSSSAYVCNLSSHLVQMMPYYLLSDGWNCIMWLFYAVWTVNTPHCVSWKQWKFVCHISEAGGLRSGCILGQVRALLQVTGFSMYLYNVEGPTELSQYLIWIWYCWNLIHEGFTIMT